MRNFPPIKFLGNASTFWVKLQKISLYLSIYYLPYRNFWICFLILYSRSVGEYSEKYIKDWFTSATYDEWFTRWLLYHSVFWNNNFFHYEKLARLFYSNVISLLRCCGFVASLFGFWLRTLWFLRDNSFVFRNQVLIYFKSQNFIQFWFFYPINSIHVPTPSKMKNVHNVLKYILKINENYKNRKIGLRKKFLFFPKFLTEQRRILQNMQSTFLHILICRTINIKEGWVFNCTTALKI